MYVWPPLDELKFLLGYQLTAVRISSWPVDLYFAKPAITAVVTLEQAVQVRLADGRVVANEHLPDSGLLLVRLIGSHITSIERKSEHCLVLHLDRASITMDAASETGECYSIIGEDRQIIV